MSTEYTPTTDEVRATFAWQGVYTYGRQVEMQSEQFDRFLATVRPNPGDARQVETVGYAMRQHHVVYDALHMVAGCACGYDGPMLADHAARAVLTALAEAGER